MAEKSAHIDSTLIKQNLLTRSKFKDSEKYENERIEGEKRKKKLSIVAFHPAAPHNQNFEIEANGINFI